MKQPLKYLVDRNLRVHAQVAEFVSGKQQVEWAGGAAEIDVLGFRGKAPRDGEWLREQILALPTIVRLVREGRIVLCTSREIQFEGMFGSIAMQGSIGDLFRDVEFQQVPPAIERSYFSASADFSRHASGSEQVKWYKAFLLKVDEKVLLESIEDYRELPEFDRQNIANLDRFKKICQHLSTDNHIRDAFHLWTAETNGLDGFLTADRRFINLMTETLSVQLPAPPVSPAQFLDSLKISDWDPLPFDDQRIRFLFDDKR